MRKNRAGQFIGTEMINATTGAAFTGAVSVLVTVGNGTQTAGGGTAPAHKGNGYHSYSPTQAETNGNHLAFTFTGTGAIPVTVQVYPVRGLVSGACTGTPTTTSLSTDITASGVDSLVGRYLVVESGAALDEATIITANTTGANTTLTVEALVTAPSSGDELTVY